MYRLGGGGDRYWLGDSPLTEGEQEGSTGWRCGDVLGRSRVKRAEGQNVWGQRRGESYDCSRARVCGVDVSPTELSTGVKGLGTHMRVLCLFLWRDRESNPHQPCNSSKVRLDS